MYRIALKMLRDKDIASDVLQDVFIAFFEVVRNGKEILNTKSYLLRATLNKCIDCSARGLRHEKIQRNYDQPSEKYEEGEDDREVIRIALNAMNGEDRKLLVLYSEGYSYKEIAEISGMKFSSVGKTLSRALKKMKEVINKLDYEMSQR